jgi:uncharacterized protein
LVDDFFQQMNRLCSQLVWRWFVAIGLLFAFNVGAMSAAEDEQTARVLLVTGIDYPGHHWRETTPVLAELLRQNKRLRVSVIEDPHFLDSAALGQYEAVILHFQNWQTPGPGPSARDNLRRFVAGGGGLVLVHFACGAWHDEWPEFERLAGRAWAGPGPEVRQHDPHGKFKVEIRDLEHPITAGLGDFETVDELYTCLVGDAPIRVLATARSKVDGKDYPMAFVLHYGQGRVFHTPLGHDVKAFSFAPVAELLRRGTAWASGLK